MLQKFNFWTDFRILAKISIFHQKLKLRFFTKIIFVLSQSSNFWPKFIFLTKIAIFDQNSVFDIKYTWRDFFYKNLLFARNLPKLYFVVENFPKSVFFVVKNRKFAEKASFLYKKLSIWPKSIVCQNSILLSKIF